MTTASIMLLAASPSRVKGLKVASIQADGAEITWTPSPEKGVVSYTVSYGPESNPMAHTMSVKAPRARVTGFKKGESWVVSVKAVNSRGLAGWDWAHAAVKAP